MRCEEAWDRIPAYAAGQLDALEADMLQRHLAGCATCQQYCAEAAEMLEIWQQPTHGLPSNGFVDRVMARIRQDSAPARQSARSRAQWRRTSLFHFGVAASLTITLMSTGLFHQFGTRIEAVDAMISNGLVKVMQYTHSLPQ